MDMTLLVFLFTFVLVLQDDRKHTVSPLFCLGVATEQFIDIDGLRVQSIQLPVFSVGFMRLNESTPDSGLAASRRTDDEHAMSDVKNVVEIDAFLDELLLRDQTHSCLCGLLAHFCQRGRLLVLRFSVREQILNQTNENRLVVSDDLRDIEVTQGSHQ